MRSGLNRIDDVKGLYTALDVSKAFDRVDQDLFFLS